MTNQTPAHQTITCSITWTVPSATQRGISYEVRANVADGRLTCTCPAGANGRSCWHVKACAAGAVGKPVIRCTTCSAPRTVTVSPAMRDFADALQV